MWWYNIERDRLIGGHLVIVRTVQRHEVCLTISFTLFSFSCHITSQLDFILTNWFVLIDFLSDFKKIQTIIIHRVRAAYTFQLVRLTWKSAVVVRLSKKEWESTRRWVNNLEDIYFLLNLSVVSQVKGRDKHASLTDIDHRGCLWANRTFPRNTFISWSAPIHIRQWTQLWPDNFQITTITMTKQQLNQILRRFSHNLVVNKLRPSPNK